MTVSTGLPSKNSATPQAGFLNDLVERDRNKQLAIWVDEQYKECKAARSQIERQWYLNMSFYYGKQYVAFLNSNAGQSAGRLVTPAAAPWRVRMTINRIRPAIRTEIARLTSQKPSASVVPASSEDQDLFAAQAAEQIWESAVTNKKIRREFRRAIWWTVITGNGFLKCWWDNSIVDPIAGTVGDIDICNTTPFHVFVPDLREEELERQRYVLNVYTISVEEAKQKYGEILGDVDLQGSVVSADEIISNAYLNLQSNKKQTDVLFYEMWLKPNAHPDFPKGGMIQVLDKYVVYKSVDGIPYRHGEYPFVKFEHIPSGKFYATSVIEDIIPPQREYNRTRSQIIEAKNRAGKPQWAAVEGSVDPSKMTSAPGQVVLYKPGFEAPKPIPINSLPPYIIEELNRNLADIEDITAQHQVSKGSVPPGVTAATAISYLQERDDSMLTHSYDSVEEGMEKLAKQYLSHVVQYWDDPRTVKVTGDDGAFDTLVLKGADIKNGTDIRMEAGSSLPTSKAARQAFLMDLMDRGYIDSQQGLRIMEIGGVQKLYEQLQVDERQATRENLKMKLMDPQLIIQWETQRDQAKTFAQSMQGAAPVGDSGGVGPSGLPPELEGMLPPDAVQAQMGAGPDTTLPGNQNMPGTPEPNDSGHFQDNTTIDPSTGLPLDFPLLVPVNTWDNHAVHIEVHNRFRKGQAFEKLTEEHKRLFEAHVKQHSDALNAAAMSNMMSSMGAPGAPSERPPGPSGTNQFSPPTAAAVPTGA